MPPAIFAVHVVPRAARTEVVGRHGDAVKIRLAAPPVDGAANEELIRFLAERLDVPRSAVTVKAGASGRRKTVAIAGVTAERAVRVLLGESPTSASRSGL
jgi:uncharacterized protein